MKKIIFKVIGAVMLCVMVLPSCKKGFEEVNTDPNNTPKALPHQLLAPSLVGVVHANMIRNRNFNNELMQVTVNRSDGDNTVFRYAFRNTTADYTWNAWYTELTNFKDLDTISREAVTLNKGYQAISLICQSWIYSLLTDTYGDIPYFDSNKARDFKIYEPKFDKQKDIYFDIFKKLEEANTILKGSGLTIEAASDPIYNGNLGRWRRFCNSLRLRLLLRISGKTEVQDEVIAEIKRIVDTEASNYPKFASNDDSAILRWTGVAPFTSPYITVRVQDFRAPAIASFFIDNLVDWGDPRIDISTYGKNGVNRLGIAQGSSGFSGVASGYLPGTEEPKQSYFYSSDQVVSGQPAQSLQTEPLTGMIMNFSELQFIYAEAASKGWINGSAETFWKNGILNGIKMWLPNWPNSTASGTPPSPAATITSPEFLLYLTTAELTWDDNNAMELIHLQKYYSLFLTDFQQWFEYRRTGLPALPKGPGLVNGAVMPARLTYPVYVGSTNPTNYKAAVEAQGPDVISTQVWWQKP